MTGITLSDLETKRYERNISVDWFSKEHQIKLKQSSVLVVGAGGLGSPALMYLAAAGVGTIGIADFDKVDLTNLQRQIIHKEKDLGNLKTISARRFIEELNGQITVIEINEKITYENGGKYFKDFNYIIDATDNAITKATINDICVENNKPFTHGSLQDTKGLIFSYIPEIKISEKNVKKANNENYKETPCYRCLIHDIQKEENLAFSGKGVLGPVCGIIGSMQALEAIKYLTGRRDLLTGKVRFFDFSDYTNHDVEFGFSKKCDFHKTKIK
jgi:molybdopterin/thiamine biosynthesis adenylyltransferase